MTIDLHRPKLAARTRGTAPNWLPALEDTALTGDHGCTTTTTDTSPSSTAKSTGRFTSHALPGPARRSGHEMFETSRVEPGWASFFWKTHDIGSNRIGSGRVGSGQEVLKSHGLGSGHPDRIRPTATYPTGEKPRKNLPQLSFQNKSTRNVLLHSCVR